ncbi:hypothetical protein AAEX37_02035 [Oligella sp. MSHR50489EDL]|uniref:hypothetical protein n=1 Tax=Oligella sp. MSHR50489EDL TaxID=3139409 RepID=UPI003D818F0C
MIAKFRRQSAAFFAWVNRRWILCTLILTVVFWIISQNIVIGFIAAFLLVVFMIMIHALIHLNQLNHKDK